MFYEFSEGVYLEVDEEQTNKGHRVITIAHFEHKSELKINLRHPVFFSNWKLKNTGKHIKLEVLLKNLIPATLHISSLSGFKCFLLHNIFLMFIFLEISTKILSDYFKRITNKNNNQTEKQNHMVTPFVIETL